MEHRKLKVGKCCENWKVGKFESLKVGNCENCENCENWKVGKLMRGHWTLLGIKAKERASHSDKTSRSLKIPNSQNLKISK